MIDIKTNLANAYKILAKLGMDDHTYTHLSSRPAGADYFYIHQFGLRFEEVQPNNLLQVNFKGEILEGNEYQYNKTGYIIHGNIYSSRPDITTIFHLHTVPMVAVSAMKEGLLPISQWALHFYNQIAYIDYDSLTLNAEQGKNLTYALKEKNIAFLRNHGVITCGKTVHEALFYCYHLELACKTQIAALSAGTELIIPSSEICEKSNKDLLGFEKDLGKRDWEAWIRYIL